MPAGTYFDALATVLRGAAVPYGYTVTVWTSGLTLTRTRGTPSVAEIFLFMAGAISAFGVLGVIVRRAQAAPLEPPHGALRRTGMANGLAVSAALGAASLIALIHSIAAWPLGAFVATATYLTLATVLLWRAQAPTHATRR
jgi:hypothetical protein